MQRLILLCTAALAALGMTGARGDVASIPAKDRIVVLITIDGFPAWLWRDPALPIPTMRRLAAEGAVAEAMTVSNPSITWINHTTLVTGVTPRKHGVLFNGLLVREGPTKPPVIEPWRDKADLVRVPTVYDAAFASGLTTAQVDWVAILNSGTINWEFLEVPKAGGVIERELVKEGVLTAPEVVAFRSKNIAWRDMVWGRAATHIIKTRKPNFLLFHLLTTDSVNHAYGPGTTASYTAFGYADHLVADLLRTLNEAGLKDRATVVITTDHGFKKVEKVIHPNVALRKAGLLEVSDKVVTSCQAYVMTQGGMAFVYVTDPAKKAELLPRLKELFTSMEGVDRVLDGADAPSLGMPTSAENQGVGDLVLFPKAGYAFQRNAEGEDVVMVSTTYLGTHGYPSTDPELDGVFIAWGHGIKPGTRLPRISNLDVAPTLAELLGVKLPDVDGKPLRELLK